MQHDGGIEGPGEGGPPRPSLARLLDEAGVASPDQVEAALVEGAQTGERLGEVLLRRAIVDEVQLARLLARQWGLPFAEDSEPNPAALSLLPREQARTLEAVPVDWQDGVLRVVVAEPTEERIGAVKRELGGDVRFAVVAASVLQRLLAWAEAAGRGADAGGDSGGVGPYLAVFAELVGDLDQGTAKMIAVRGRLEQLAAELLEREQALARSEGELAEARRARERDLHTIDQLQREVDELRSSGQHHEDALRELRGELDRRNELLASSKQQLMEMANAFGGFGIE
jgi:hypothetical protein